jgi:hypothetical protein
MDASLNKKNRKENKITSDSFLRKTLKRLIVFDVSSVSRSAVLMNLGQTWIPFLSSGMEEFPLRDYKRKQISNTFSPFA